MMKKIRYILLSIFILSFYNGALAESKSGYALYQERVQTVCSIYKPDTMLFQALHYDDLDKKPPQTGELSYAQGIYKTGMNDIYKCALLNLQDETYNIVLEKLISTSPELKNLSKNRIQQEMKKIELKKKNSKCTQAPATNNALQKLTLLKQTSYELCKYHSYLEYLKTRSNHIETLVKSIESQNQAIKNNSGADHQYIQGDDTQFSSTAIHQINNTSQDQLNAIKNEIDRSYKIFGLAYQSYSEYENNFAIHILLELLRDDFYLYRKHLNAVLNPINQVVYKISNAMKLP